MRLFDTTDTDEQIDARAAEAEAEYARLQETAEQRTAEAERAAAQYRAARTAPNLTAAQLANDIAGDARAAVADHIAAVLKPLRLEATRRREIARMHELRAITAEWPTTANAFGERIERLYGEFRDALHAELSALSRAIREHRDHRSEQFTLELKHGDRAAGMATEHLTFSSVTRQIDARLRERLGDRRKGVVTGPFPSTAELVFSEHTGGAGHSLVLARMTIDTTATVDPSLLE